MVMYYLYVIRPVLLQSCMFTMFHVLALNVILEEATACMCFLKLRAAVHCTSKTEWKPIHNGN